MLLNPLCPHSSHRKRLTYRVTCVSLASMLYVTSTKQNKSRLFWLVFALQRQLCAFLVHIYHVWLYCMNELFHHRSTCIRVVERWGLPALPVHAYVLYVAFVCTRCVRISVVQGKTKWSFSRQSDTWMRSIGMVEGNRVSTLRYSHKYFMSQRQYWIPY